jgi:hypothetical protein
LTIKEDDWDSYAASSAGASGAITKPGPTETLVNAKGSVPKTADDNTGAIGRIGLMASVPVLLVLIGLDFAFRAMRRRKYR